MLLSSVTSRVPSPLVVEAKVLMLPSTAFVDGLFVSSTPDVKLVGWFNATFVPSELCTRSSCTLKLPDELLNVTYLTLS